MKVFVFLTLVAFSSAHYTGSAHVHDTIADLQGLQVQTFSAARADIRAGIDTIVGMLTNPSSATSHELYDILENGVSIAHHIVRDLVNVVDKNGDGSVKDEAKTAIKNFEDHVVNQFGIFEQRAVQEANADQKSQIHDHIQGMIKQCFKNLEPLFQRMHQLA